MYLNIITPCSRPENLHRIAETINIPKEHYRWIVVFDFLITPDQSLIPAICETHCFQMNGSIVGHAQRNYALNLIEKGHIYFNDDDTCIHADLWENIKNCDEADFISFPQLNKNGHLRLKSDVIEVGYIDSHNFIVSCDVAKKHQFEIDKYEADGIFAKSCYEDALKPHYISTPLSIYNQLR